MRVARWQNNVTTLGPGNRVALWVRGCSNTCKGCIAEELRSHEGFPDMDVHILAAIINTLLMQPNVDGLTISGGEPMEQGDELAQFLTSVETEDILLYTGWTFEKVKRHPAWPCISGRIAAIIPEPYIAEQDNGRSLRGSDNQPLIVLKQQFRNRYEQAAKQTRCVQMQQVSDGIVFAGIPPKEFSLVIQQRRAKNENNQTQLSGEHSAI